jgi:hypothetical protein
VQLGLSTFDLQLTKMNDVHRSDPAVSKGHYAAFGSIGVTVRYAVDGVDSTLVAVPWVPIVGFTAGRWFITGESVDEASLYSVGGQPWEGGPVVVRRGANVTLVLGSAHQDLAGRLLVLAEQGVAAARAFWPEWNGKILLVAGPLPGCTKGSPTTFPTSRRTSRN